MKGGEKGLVFFKLPTTANIFTHVSRSTDSYMTNLTIIIGLPAVM